MICPHVTEACKGAVQGFPKACSHSKDHKWNLTCNARCNRPITPEEDALLKEQSGYFQELMRQPYVESPDLPADSATDREKAAYRVAQEAYMAEIGRRNEIRAKCQNIDNHGNFISKRYGACK